MGYVAAVSPEDKKDDEDPLLDLPGFRIGKRGIEKAFDTEVRGQAGASRVEVNAYGRVIRELSRDQGVAGKDVWLTIDSELQRFTDQRLGQESAACCVLDAQTGDRARPVLDARLRSQPVQCRHLAHRLEGADDQRPQSAAEQGDQRRLSARLDLQAGDGAGAGAGRRAADFSVNCSGVLTLGTSQFHCWKRGGHGHVDLKRGIAQSCDVFFYEVARRLGIDKMEAAARALGMGAATGVEIPGENSGFIPGAAWKEARFGIPWAGRRDAQYRHRQGYVLVTPLQLATLAARIASGRAVTPRIAHTVGGTAQPRPLPDPLPFSDTAFAAVREGMNAVCNEGRYGLAWRIAQPGMEMAGKTGTAQVRRITRRSAPAACAMTPRCPGICGTTASTSLSRRAAPRYAISCIVEHGALGHPQVQIAHDVLLFAQTRNPLGLRTAYPASAAMAAPPAPLGNQG